MRRALIREARVSGSVPHSPYSPPSPEWVAEARRLFARSSAANVSDAELLSSAERIGECVPDALARWFGPYGSLALMTRALAIAAAAHRSLGAVTVESSQSPRLVGMAASARTYGAHEIAEGVIALLAALIELLCRLIGDDLALKLLEPCAAPTDRAISNASSNGQGPHTVNPSDQASPGDRIPPDTRFKAGGVSHTTSDS
jgi:hypothetical protein